MKAISILTGLLILSAILILAFSCKLLCDEDDRYYPMPDSNKNIFYTIDTLSFSDAQYNMIDTLIINVMDIENYCEELKKSFECSWTVCSESQTTYYYRDSLTEDTGIGSVLVNWNGNIYLDFNGFKGEIRMNNNTLYSGGEFEINDKFGNVYVLKNDDCTNDSIPEIVYFTYKYGIIRYQKCQGSIYELIIE